MLHWMSSSPCKLFTYCLALSLEKLLLANFRLATLGMSSTLSLLFLSVRYISSYHLPLTTTIICAAVLLYDYCLTLVAEVERCWSARQLNWGLGFFYLNRYLTLFAHVPIMLEFFWSTSNPNKTEVSIPLLQSREVERY